MNHAALLTELEAEEGFKAGLYLDSVNLLTIGIGRCLERQPLTAFEWRQLFDAKQITVALTHEGAVALATTTLETVLGSLSQAIRGWQGLPEAAQHVLVNMAYQLGLQGLLAFRNALGAAERHDWTRMAAELRSSTWYTQAPHRAEQLATRIEALANG
jgi:lysozyme